MSVLWLAPYKNSVSLCLRFEVSIRAKGFIAHPAELEKIYESEINIEIAWVWDGGIDVRLGDKLNGFLAEENVRSVSGIIHWLQEAIAHFYPESEYAASLEDEVRARAARRSGPIERTHSVDLPRRHGAAGNSGGTSS